MKRTAMTIGSAVVLVLGVMTAPLAFMAVAWQATSPLYVIVAVALIGFGALGVVGYRPRSR